MSKQQSYDDLPPAQRQEVTRLNQMQQQLEMIIQQRVSIESQAKEMDFALKELQEAGEQAVCYKSVGGLFIKSDQKKLLTDTKDKKETMEMRVKSMQNQEDRLKKQFEEQRTKLQAMFGQK
jgi:prefoldin beta subunit